MPDKGIVKKTKLPPIYCSGYAITGIPPSIPCHKCRGFVKKYGKFGRPLYNA